MKREKGINHKTFYCSELLYSSDGDRIFDIFLINDVRYFSNERGKKWLNVRLEDKSGTMYAKVWADRMEQEYEGYKDQVCYVSGMVTYYAGKPDFIIDKMQPAPEGEFEISEVLKVLRKDKINAYIKNILTLTNNIVSNEIKSFVSVLINESSLNEMAALPVNTKGHHSYRGGLLEHVCEVLTSSYYYAKSTAAVRDIKYDLDLIIAGAVLHDIGSLELYKSSGYGFSVAGFDKLAGESYVTVNVLEQALQECMIDGVTIERETYSLLVHIINASHGYVGAQTMEAMLVRQMNQLSAELERYENCCASNRLMQLNTDFIWSKDLKREITTIRRKR